MKGLVFHLMALLAFAGTSALAADSDVRPSVSALVKDSGIDVYLSAVGPQTRDVFLDRDKSSTVFPGDFIDEAAGVMARALDGKDLIADVELGLDGAMSEDQVDEVRGFYASDLGSRLLAAERVGASAESAAIVGSQGESIVDELKKNQTRLDAVTLLSDRGDCAAMSVSVYAEMGVAMMVQRNVVTDRPAPDETERANIRASARSMLLDGASQSCLANMALTYRAFKTEEIEQYADFYDTDAMRVVTEKIRETLDRFFGKAGTALVDSMLKYAKAHPRVPTVKS